LRLDIWRSALAMVRDRPLLGYGPDGFLYAYSPRYVAPAAWAERFTAHAHNLFLDFWVRLGIIGGALAVFVAGYLVVSTVAFVRTRDGRDALADAALLALVASLVHGFVDNAYFAHDLAMSAWLLAWLAFGERDVPAGKGAIAVASPRRRWLGVHRVAPLR
jgi:O-antigen ligase